MSGAGFLCSTMSPANTANASASVGPTADVRTATTDAPGRSSTARDPSRRHGPPPQPRDTRATRQRPGDRHRHEQLGLAPVPARDLGQLPVVITGQPRGLHEPGCEQGGETLLAATDPQLLSVVVHAPLDRQAELPEGLVEGRQVPVTLGVGDHAVTVEDEQAHALPPEPNSRTWVRTISITLSRWWRNRVGGSAASGCWVRNSRLARM